MNRVQRAQYQILREQNWEFDEEFPAAGIIILRIRRESGVSYKTICKDGRVKNGRHPPC